MIASKLTLSAKKDTIDDAKRLAEERHTSVSALFARFIGALKHVDHPTASFSSAPLTRRAAGLIHLPDDVDDKTLIANAIADKYGL